MSVTLVMTATLVMNGLVCHQQSCMARLSRGLGESERACMGARRRKFNQQAASGLDTQAEYLDTDNIIKTPAKRDGTWYTLAAALVSAAVLTAWGVLYVLHKALKH